MSSKAINRNMADWEKIYHRSHRPVKLRGLFNSSYFTIRFVALIPILIISFLLPRSQLSWEPNSTLIFLVFLAWLSWSVWPAIENQWASRFVVRASIELKLGTSFWQGDMFPIEILIHEAFKLTPKGNLINADSWIGHCRVSIPDSLYHQVYEKEELVLLCFSTRKIVKILKDLSNS